MKSKQNLKRLEEAYVASRYLPIAYKESETKDIFRFVKEVFKPIVENL